MFGQMSWSHRSAGQPARPRTGTTLAFKPAAEPALAGIPARVVQVWPRFPSGDYLVTLEYDRPVKLRNVFLRQLDAFASELYAPTGAAPRLH